MASVIVPIPNQPVYTWQMSFSSIGMRGKVIGTATTLPIYGNVITGTQTILYIPVIYKGRDHKGRIYIHGFHLSAHSILGSTRYRIPMIVRIWNYVLNGINVIATIMDMDHHVNVIATASHETGSMNHTYLHLGGIETINWIKLCFTLTGIKKMFYTIYTTLPTIYHKHKTYISVLKDRITMKLKTMVDTYNATRKQKLFVDNIRDRVQKKLKLKTDIVSPNYERLLKLMANIVRPTHERVFKLRTEVSTNNLVRDFKMQVKLWGNTIKQTLKLQVRALHTRIEQTCKLSVNITGQVLEGIMSYILFLIEGYYVEQVVDAHVSLIEHSDTATVHSTAGSKIKTTGWTIVNLLKSVFSRIVKTDILRSLKNSMISIWTAPELITANVSAHTKIEKFQSKLNLFLHTEQLRAEKVLLEIDIISWLGETNLIFDPTNQPRTELLNVMITVCETWVLAYLNFVPDELINEIDVMMSTCSHEMSSILQWYLHGGRISNHGGNEVIFDLGDVDPLGPIPPVPSRQWQGGWVEDPFKGVGYIPAADSTGYGSPSAQEWLSNVKMFWDKASEPFIKEGGNP